jgi:Fe-S-cluster-containing dehydrogenase component
MQLKVVIMPHFEINIDAKLCWGCRTCEVACKQEYGASGGINLISVHESVPMISGDRAEFQFQVNLCRHCDDPPCADACPEEAIVKRDDGIVVMDDDICTGCQACIADCHYDAITFDNDKDIAQKCNLCHHRVDRGLIPACADNVCPAHCIEFKQI